MNAENIITVLVAIIGSGALSTVITLVATRFRHDRQVDQLETWAKELKLLDDLERRSGLEYSDDISRSRDRAVAIAGRSQLRSLIARRIVPPALFQLIALVLASLMMALLAIMMGTAATLSWTEPHLFDGLETLWFLRVPGIAFTLAFVALSAAIYWVGYAGDSYRTRMRNVVLVALANADAPAGVDLQSFPNDKHAKKFRWLPGTRAEFGKRHNAVPSHVREAFSEFLAEG